jgi:hypothetical protein
MTIIGKLEPASLPNHVSMDREAKPFRSATQALHHPVEGIGHKHERPRMYAAEQ